MLQLLPQGRKLTHFLIAKSVEQILAQTLTKCQKLLANRFHIRDGFRRVSPNVIDYFGPAEYCDRQMIAISTVDTW